MTDRNISTEEQVFVVGQYDTDGNYMPYAKPERAYPFGRSLRNRDGFPLAVKDSYGDWVSPTMHAIGVKSRIKVETHPSALERGTP